MTTHDAPARPTPDGALPGTAAPDPRKRPVSPRHYFNQAHGDSDVTQ